MSRAFDYPALSWLLAAALASASTPAVAQEAGEDARPAQTYRLDFQSIPLSELVLIVSAITGDNYVFVPDTLTSRRIMLVSPRPLSAADVGDLFIAALSMTGLTVEDRGSFWVIRED